MERRAVLRLADSWIWDFWFADDGHTYHVFFLKASRSLGDPELRHLNVAIGHASSEDLIGWAVAADVLAPAASPAFDDVATWTGSVIRGPDGIWFMFYTGGTNTPARRQAAHRRGHLGRPVHLAAASRLARGRVRPPLV